MQTIDILLDEYSPDFMVVTSIVIIIIIVVIIINITITNTIFFNIALLDSASLIQ
jgi:hypothetical protein